MFRFSVHVISTLLVIASSAVNAGSFDKFIDPESGNFDASNYLLDHHGVLPVPIVISDPAVGYGFGVAGAYFHRRKGGEDLDEDGVPLISPSVSALAAGYTENDSWFVGGGHLGIWKNDHVRYTGVLGYADLNLTFYAGDQSDGFDGFDFEIQGTFIDQEVVFRIGESDWFLGGSYRYLNSDVAFLTGLDIPGLDRLESGATSSGVSLLAEYDNRNNLFSPTQGQYFELEALFNLQALGSDEDFENYHAKALFWWPFGSFVGGLRLDGKSTSGDTPFYEVPFIEMRGIPAMRYQGETVGVVETELTWKVTPRWSVLGFVGAGWAADSASDLSDESDTIISKGVGFRYLIASKLSLWSGIDIASGPEDTVFYIQAGSAWR
jgi:hypothetical protein